MTELVALTFLLPVPIALAILAAVAPRVIRPDPPALSARRGFDIPGAVTITAAMLLFVRTVVEAPEAGWASLVTIGSFAAVALLALFVAIEQRTPQPLVRLGILRSGNIARANIAAMATFALRHQFVATLFLCRRSAGRRRPRGLPARRPDRGLRTGARRGY